MLSSRLKAGLYNSTRHNRVSMIRSRPVYGSYAPQLRYPLMQKILCKKCFGES